MAPWEVMRVNPHPVAALLKARGWNDADRQSLEEEAFDWLTDGWAPTWRVTRASHAGAHGNPRPPRYDP